MSEKICSERAPRKMLGVSGGGEGVLLPGCLAPRERHLGVLGLCSRMDSILGALLTRPQGGRDAVTFPGIRGPQ